MDNQTAVHSYNKLINKKEQTTDTPNNNMDESQSVSIKLSRRNQIHKTTNYIIPFI